ncbi:organic cation transporter protein-like [Leguminivora glycinivorella]|uniref:organic cation transporter protein-like n=1 Tax=Leguminivora glycinivorella TaxID=1035111 RepID=UPI00200D8497|nr:organic cation transporter protein-like [Leguminivora glycinivorella]XP_047990495.1 organic cation transporter protein-like [Leguminivora glycinivorella]XP_047990496.1 organic cation transporter protein-like [Leguminivora glycinivorella]XP_047990497.1 organic cation transporter protein-like [Leguminivora glycinivorella]
MTVGKREVNLDRILVEDIGQWGRFQFRAVALCALVALVGSVQCYAYLFTVVKVNTRCLIPECEAGDPVFSPPWLPRAVPPSGNSLDSCRRFPARTGNSSESCPADWFIRNESVRCEEYVYEHKNSAYYEFGLACDSWRPTLIGSARTLGYMLCLPLTGLLADRRGRRLALALNLLNSVWLGSLAYFAPSYNAYLAISFVEALFGACTFCSAYILAVEYVGPKYRVATGVTMSTCLAIGQTLLGPIAWTEPYWRNLILILYLPQFIFVSYFWIAPESVRWLISKGRYEEALEILKKAAKMNGSALSEKTLKEFSELKDVTKEKDTEQSDPWLICLVFKHKAMLLRCLVTPVWWITCIFMYYGLTISSVGISGNRYINYSACNAVEIPGYWAAVLLLDRVGRKAVLTAGFLISGACQIAFIFVSDGNYWVSLTVYLIGKMCVSSVVTSLYVYTAELYPTRHRSSLFAYSSMVGRIGGILAPLMPGVAAVVWEQLPFVVFGALALVSGMLVLLAPETLGAPLPDSMEDAVELGKEAPSLHQWVKTLVFRSKSYNIR